jgi:hypothetical protein
MVNKKFLKIFYFLDYWFKFSSEMKFDNYLNPTNIWILINFFRSKQASWNYGKMGVNDMLKFSAIFENLLKTAFDWYKLGKVKVNDFSKINKSIQNEFMLKILFKILICKFKESDEWYNNFDFYFAAFSNVRRIKFF